MKVRYFCSFLIFISFLRSSVGMDLLRPHQKRYKEYMKTPGLFHQEKFKTAVLSNTSVISRECSSALNDLFATNNFKESAQFFDAWGSIPSGLLYGQTTDFGNFDECEAATLPSSDYSEKLRGKYTLLSADVILKTDDYTFNVFLFNFGVCLPHTCNRFEINEIFSANYNTVKKFLDLYGKSTIDDDTKNHEITFATQSDKEDIDDRHWFAAKVGIAVFSMILTLNIVSSLYELIIMNTKGEPNDLLRSFSVLMNAKQLFQITPKNSVSPNIIECLNGVRVLSLIWNIYGHTYMWSFSRADSNVPYRIQVLQKNLYGRILTTANFSVDSFILLSGLLVAWTGLNGMNRRHGRINIKLMYLHRYLRLAPSYAATILFASGLYVYVGNGPMWYKNTLALTETCEKYWWRALFFISNYYSQYEMCIGHSWFLAVDIQLYILSPFILMGLWKWRMKMVPILIFLICLSYYTVFAGTLSLNREEFPFDGLMLGNFVFQKVQYPTEMRAGTWLIGILLGYSLFKQRHRTLKMSKKIVAILWFLALLVITLIVFGPQHLYERFINPSVFVAALYESLARCGWALSLSWIIFSCYMGYSEFINAFLSHEFWQVIAKLNYTIYIVKTFMNINNLALQTTDAHFSHYDMIAEFWSDFGISTSLAVMLSLSVELPFLAIERYFIKSKVQRSKLTT